MTAENAEATGRAHNRRVLVSAASLHGATAEIAQAIGQTLSEQGLTVRVIPPGDVRNLDGCDAVIVGSAVYMGHWLDPAKDLVNRFHEALTDRPVWLFPAVRSGSQPASWPSRWTKIPLTFPEYSKPPTRGSTADSLASSTGKF
jgi:menaquinone-dependent protoporphyrinogen IX oxidase